MQRYEEKILIEVLGNKELDVFGIYRRRREKQEKSQKHKIFIIEIEKQRQRRIKFCEIMSKRLVEIYGTEGAIPYLKVLLTPKNAKEKVE